MDSGPINFVSAALLAALFAAASRAWAADSDGLTLFPVTELYPPYIADPHRAGFGFQFMSVSDVAIPDAGDSRYAIRVGGRLGLLRRGAVAQPGSWQLSVDAGFSGQFDTDHSADNIGWDGIYGLTLAWAIRPDLRVKVGTMHWSSHVGDEYAERTGRRRINYTRGEYLAGASWQFADRWRAYADYGHAYDIRNDELQQPGRAQTGLEYESPRRLWSGRAGWYAALDVSATEERDWKLDRALQAGFAVQAGERRWRFGIEHYRGRPPMGEFFQFTETYTALGLWMEL